MDGSLDKAADSASILAECGPHTMHVHVLRQQTSSRRNCFIGLAYRSRTLCIRGEFSVLDGIFYLLNGRVPKTKHPF